MSDAADWVAAVGGSIGAIGGPAGMWAAWTVHRQNRRRRFGPPEELVGLLGKVLDVTDSAPIMYRDAEWFERTGVREAVARIDELSHLVSDSLLDAYLRMVILKGQAMLDAVTRSGDSPERVATIVARQATSATDAHQHAKTALAELRQRL
ncbi:hypothetical protein GCM10010363_38730 [Streptomyces omiyaensis]|uniref:hypothetical protein n=1 Tax=Streptomyces omiyaensis TaxID=68247 RepID=UPI001676787D|nr:hypothetical protein [Streptomyces omiyaensis]GGY53824.1 hypothetical protein GCM10010363_38730 [Streptomyces omiyaensis]